MAGALSLQEDIIALVEKHSDSCLPEYLLRRLAEEARLLAAREEIRDSLKNRATVIVSALCENRSLHEEDRFGLFSEPSIAENDRVGEEKEDLEEPGEGKDENISVLPENVKQMLATMKVVRLDKVVALSGFTTIDAEVEFKPQSSATEEQRGEKEAGRSEMASENRPVFLTFRFRREPLTKGGPEGDFSDSKNDAAAMAAVESVDLEAEGEDNDDAGNVVTSKDQATLMKVPNGDKLDVASDNNGATRLGSEGRKRAVSRGVEFDIRGGSDKGRKRSKGGRDQEEGEGDEDEDGEDDSYGVTDESDSVFEDLDDDADSESDRGLDYEPKTLVSYTICGGIGYDRPEVLLQAVVYARGDGPACIMPPPDDEEDPESVFRDQEDVFDCNVDGPALAAVGQALGLHYEPTALESPGGNNGEQGLDLKEAGGLGCGEGMTVSDLVWWIMLFPFFEEEFDIVEVVASSVFGDEGSDSDDGECDSEERNDDGGEGANGRREKA